MIFRRMRRLKVRILITFFISLFSLVSLNFCNNSERFVSSSTDVNRHSGTEISGESDRHFYHHHNGFSGSAGSQEKKFCGREIRRLDEKFCGNGIREEGELCERGDFVNCRKLGYSSGFAYCTSSCSRWDVSSCVQDGEYLFDYDFYK